MELNEHHSEASLSEKDMQENYISLEQHQQMISSIRKYWIEAYREDMEKMSNDYKRVIKIWERNTYMSLLMFIVVFVAYVCK